MDGVAHPIHRWSWLATLKNHHMTANAIQTLLTSSITIYGSTMVAVLGAVLAIIVGLLVVRMGIKWMNSPGMTGDWRSLRYDKKHSDFID